MESVFGMTISPRQHYVRLAALFLLAGLLATPLDLPVARTCEAHELPGEFRKVLQLSEVFAHGAGVVFILATIWFVQRLRLGAMLRMVACSFGAGLLADVFKLFVWRVRPARFDLDGHVLDTFQGFLPWLSGPLENAFNWGQTSLPSGHVAVAVGLATVLGAMYPRGRYWFYVLAVLVAIQRIVVGAHFLSDVLWGAVPAFLVAHLCLSNAWSREFFVELRFDTAWRAILWRQPAVEWTLISDRQEPSLSAVSSESASDAMCESAMALDPERFREADRTPEADAMDQRICA